MPTIELSDQTYAELGRIATPFVETDPEDVILRLIRGMEAKQSTPAKPKRKAVSGTGRPLSSNSGSIPHGRNLRAKYKGKTYHATIVNGHVEWNGRRYDSISAAAIAVIRSTGSRRASENGWRFWEVEESNGKWVSARSWRAP